MNLKYIIFISLIFFSCSNEKKEKKIKIEEITRKRGDVYFKFEPTDNRSLSYPFEANQPLPKITKEFFRCKGNPLNPEKITKDKKILDCEGSLHPLSIVHDKEGVYQVLIDILNHIQNKTKKRVIITSGFLCPKHLKYIDSKNETKLSKHLIGAEVDFYVLGFEKQPQKIVELIKDFYENSKKKDYKNLPLKRITLSSWQNKEILLNLYKANENRDFDNRHPYPYLSLQVLWDRKLDQKVVLMKDLINKVQFE